MSEAWHEVAQREAIKARGRAYAPYSGFFVGAALVGEGHVIPGANIENASYGATICAERSAACAALSAGVTKWDGMAIVADGGPVPCGICLQFLSEFDPKLALLLVDSATGDTRLTSIAELLPNAFRLTNR